MICMALFLAVTHRLLYPMIRAQSNNKAMPDYSEIIHS